MRHAWSRQLSTSCGRQSQEGFTARLPPLRRSFANDHQACRRRSHCHHRDPNVRDLCHAEYVFGYETSEKDPQITMREQALSIGGAYLSLEDFEKTQQDAIITGEAAAYENQGVTIDEIRVSSKFDEEDLCWYIAINSVAHKQDLSEMKPEEVQSLLISNLKHTTRLESSGNQTVLRIIFQPLDKDKLMDDLAFDEDAKRGQAHCLRRSMRATRWVNTKTNLKLISQITRAIPAIPARQNPPLAAVVAEAARRAAAAPTIPSTSPALQIRAQKQP